jgi:predicted nucleotidyltransferase
MFDVNQRTIYLTKHGSHAYGLATSHSDLDTKGVCIEPKNYHLGYLNHFEQSERYANKGHTHDEVIYSLKKFVKLAADCNPNIIEVMFASQEDYIKIDKFGERLLEKRDDFLSKKAKHTFSGYAHAQLKRIQNHRSWLLNPPKKEPTRSDFGLPDQIESVIHILNGQVTDNLTEVIEKTNKYKEAKNHWDQFKHWEKSRNPARSEQERKYGYDTKHASHLIRLMKMCREILNGQGVIVKRPDREELLAIKLHGAIKYEDLLEYASKLEAECNELYANSKLRHDPNRIKLDQLVVDLTEEYLILYG